MNTIEYMKHIEEMSMELRWGRKKYQSAIASNKAPVVIYISTSAGSEFVQGLTACKSLPPALGTRNDTKSIWARYIRLKCIEDISAWVMQEFKQR